MTEYKFVDAGRRYKDQALDWYDWQDEGKSLETDEPLTTTLGELLCLQRQEQPR